MECIVDSETGGIGFRRLNTDDDTVEFFATYDNGELYTKTWDVEEFINLLEAGPMLAEDVLPEETRESLNEFLAV